MQGKTKKIRGIYVSKNNLTKKIKSLTNQVGLAARIKNPDYDEERAGFGVIESIGMMPEPEFFYEEARAKEKGFFLVEDKRGYVIEIHTPSQVAKLLEIERISDEEIIETWEVKQK